LNLSSDIEFYGGRVFVSPAYGCTSKCGFCYLVHVRGSEKISVSKLTGDDLVLQLLANPQFRPGKNGTLISFSPHTESLDERVFPKLLEFIKAISYLRNPMQIATKRQVTPSHAIQLVNSIKYENQLVIFISSSTITYHDVFETATTIPLQRFEGFAACHAVGLPTCLYVKPVIPQISLLDIKLYIALIEQYTIKYCCVGAFYGNVEIIQKMNRKFEYLSLEKIGKPEGNLLLPFDKRLQQIQIPFSVGKKRS
jgi:DNA repair photolyase